MHKDRYFRNRGYRKIFQIGDGVNYDWHSRTVQKYTESDFPFTGGAGVAKDSKNPLLLSSSYGLD